MRRLLDRSIATLPARLVVVAPGSVPSHHRFQHIVWDSTRRRTMLRDVQRARGAIYLQDGAIEPHQLSADGRHHTAEDERSWHLLFLNQQGAVSACVWYLDQGRAPSFDRLRVTANPLNQPGMTARLRGAVESELQRARSGGLSYAEIGGWAVAPESRCTSEGLLLALGAYSLGRLLGGALGMTTATVRHASSSILRRLGGSPLEHAGEPIPAYYDPKYRCTMELLRFDSRFPSPRYARLVDSLCDKLLHVPVITGAVAAHFGGLTLPHAEPSAA